MGIEIPDELQWVAKYVLGAGDWPDGDETAMRRVADGWTAMANTLDTVDDAAAKALNIALAAISEGETHTSIATFRDKLLSGDQATFAAVRTWCEKQAELLDDGANDIEHTKLVIIGTMIVTAVELAVALATSWTGVGAVAGVAARVAAQVAIRVAIKQLIARMLTRGAAKAAARLALRGAAFEALEEGGLDLAARMIQVSNGDRTGEKFGVSDFVLATFGGVVGGAVGGVLGGGTGALGDVASSTAGKVAGKVVGGTVTELGADMSAQVAAAGAGAAFLHREFQLDIGVETFTSAGAGGVQTALESGGHGGNATAPTVPELGTETPGATTPAATDTPKEPADQAPAGTDTASPTNDDTPAGTDSANPTNSAPTTPSGTDSESPTAPASTGDQGAAGNEAPSPQNSTPDAPTTGDPSATPNNNGTNGTPPAGDSAPSNTDGSGATDSAPPSTPNNPTAPESSPGDTEPSSPNSNSPAETPSTSDTTQPSPNTNAPTSDPPSPNSPGITESSLDLPPQALPTPSDAPAENPPTNSPPTQQNPAPLTAENSTPPTAPANPQTPTTPESTPQQSPTSTPTSQPATPTNNPTHTPSDTTRPTATDTSTATATTSTAPSAQTGIPTSATVATPSTTPPTPPNSAPPTATQTPPFTQAPTTAQPSPRPTNPLRQADGTPTAAPSHPAAAAPSTAVTPPPIQTRPLTTTPGPSPTAATTPPSQISPNQHQLGTSPTPPHSPNNAQAFGPNPTPTIAPSNQTNATPPPRNRARALREALRNLPSQDGRSPAVDANRNPFAQRPPAYRVRRFQLSDGSWVAVASIRAYLPNAHLLSPNDLRQAAESIQATVDATFNDGSKLLSGDRFLVDLEFTTDPDNADLALNPNEQTNRQSNILRDHLGLFPTEPNTTLNPDDLREISNDIARANTPTRFADPADSRVVDHERLDDVENPTYQAYVEDILRQGNSFVAGADPRTHPYGQSVNDGGRTQPGRGNNCLDCSLSALSSFFGIPRVSAPRWPDQNPDGTPDTRSGERGGIERAATWLGSDWVSYSPSIALAAQYQSLHNYVAGMGPGSAAIVATWWHSRDENGNFEYHPDGSPVIKGGHATVIVFPPGATGPVWWDPQSGQTFDAPPANLIDGAASMSCIPIDANGGPQNAGTSTNQGTSQTPAGPSVQPDPEVQHRGEQPRMGMQSDGIGGRPPSELRPGELRDQQTHRSDHGPLEHEHGDNRPGVRPNDRSGAPTAGLSGLPETAPDSPDPNLREPEHHRISGTPDVPGEPGQPGDHPGSRDHQEPDPSQSNGPGLGSRDVMGLRPEPKHGDMASGGDDRAVGDRNGPADPGRPGISPTSPNPSAESLRGPADSSVRSPSDRPGSTEQPGNDRTVTQVSNNPSTSSPATSTPPTATPTSSAPVNSTTPASHQPSTSSQPTPTTANTPTPAIRPTPPAAPWNTPTTTPSPGTIPTRTAAQPSPEPTAQRQTTTTRSSGPVEPSNVRGTTPIPTNGGSHPPSQPSSPISTPTPQQMNNANQSRVARDNLRTQQPDGGILPVTDLNGRPRFTVGRYTTALGAPVSVLRITVRVVGGGNLSSATVNALIERAQLAVDLHFNSGSQLLSGDWMMVDLVPVTGPGADMTVDLDPGGPESLSPATELAALTTLLRQQIGLVDNGGTALNANDVQELSNSIAQAGQVSPPSLDEVDIGHPGLYDRTGNVVPTPVLPLQNPAGWIGSINPGYPHVTGTDNNCGDCTRASEMRWRGIEPQAGRNTDPHGDGEPNSCMDDWERGERITATFQEIQDTLSQLGPGSSAIVGVDWHGGGGHWFNAFNVEGIPMASDSQNSTLEPWPPSDQGVGYDESYARSIDVMYIDADGNHLRESELP
ncbi:toxin glutamine deamidase domain-containing protein [Nocardia salmonicida]|uniref:toxin glutamine deamidase domain-containing protein n=1 Tax=Nocardia salmonicida TaxID=53431 RepID=UPI00368FDF4E